MAMTSSDDESEASVQRNDSPSDEEDLENKAL